MDEDVKSALRLAVQRCLPILERVIDGCQEPSLIWSRGTGGILQRRVQKRINIDRALALVQEEVAKAALEFADLFFSKHPEYGEGNLVGCAGLVSENLGFPRALIVNRTIRWLWNKHGNLDLDNTCIDSVVDEFADFIRSPKILIQFQSVLLNVKMEMPSFELTEELGVRRLNALEFTDLQADCVGSDHFPCFHEFVIEGKLEASKTFTGQIPDHSLYENILLQLEKSIRCLRTFKAGQPAYSSARFKLVKFCPLELPTYRFITWSSLMGTYQLFEKDLPALREHARNIFALNESAMESACSRLSDAEGRFRAQDQILDAVIGMEALLLAGLAKEDRRSELKFRFALNYSSLFGSPGDRRGAFRLAKDLYDCRSTIAHGGALPNDVRLGQEKLNQHETAQLAKATLRWLIRRLLPDWRVAPYKKPAFWENAYFGTAQSEALKSGAPDPQA